MPREEWARRSRRRLKERERDEEWRKRGLRERGNEGERWGG